MNEIITIENASNIIVKGATKVASATNSQAVVETSTSNIIISGQNLEVRKLDLENGEVIFAGKATNIKFLSSSGEKLPFLKRIFK